MVLNNVNLLTQNEAVSIQTNDTKITSVGSFQNAGDPFQLQFEHAIAFPGLINSHDHLDFNLFPMLGNRPYNNYTDWGNSIHKVYKAEIDEILKIPEAIRVAWGIYKNLLCGVTTVVNHGKKLQITHPLINIIQPGQNLHSVKFEKFWKQKLNNPFKKNIPCVIHAGEGTDSQSKNEIDELIKWNLLKRELIAVHGVSMNEQQAKSFKSLIWCPASNYFLFEKTAPVDKLKDHTLICFGTDSTLTSDWNIWNHLRMARQCKLASDNELFDMITTTPANLWNLQSGLISEGNDADMVVVKAKDNSFESFYAIDPGDILLVVQNGNIRLFDISLHDQLKTTAPGINNFKSVTIGGQDKFVEGDLPSLLNKIKSYSQHIIRSVDTNN